MAEFPKKDAEKCSEIRDDIDKWEKYWTINRSQYYDMTDFILGDQWREDESKLFERYNKIPLTVNKLGVLRNNVLGDYMQNTPNLQVMPDEDVSAEQANIRAALVKNIALNSETKNIFQKVLAQAIVGGYSAFHTYTDYIERSFDQEIKVDMRVDPNQYYFDISAKHPCKVDGRRSGYKTRISRRTFRDTWGKEIESQIATTAITEDSTMAFADDDSITQIEDFERKAEKRVIYLLSDNSVIDDEEFKKLEDVKIEKKKFKIKDGNIVNVLQKRNETKYKVIHRKIAGDFILDETEFPSELLPVIFVDHDSYYSKQGQQITRSFFKDVKDAQRYLNYLATQSAYLMKISRYDQFMAPRKCVSAPDTMQMWRDPSIVQGVLPYDETPSGNKPEQIRPPELSVSFVQQYERTLMDIQSGTGLFNAQLGEIGNEVSGVAVERRTKRGTKNTQVPRTSVDFAIATLGVIIDQMIPKVYDTERKLILSMPESESMPVVINQKMDDYGTFVKNDMSKGRYKIRIKPGPSYEGEKEEALESMQLVLNADKNGQVFPMIADLYAENLPLDNNIEIRNRLRTIVPPEIIEAGKTGKPLPPKPQQPSPDQVLAQLKAQELQMKQQDAERQYQLKMQELQIKQAEIQRKALETHQDMTMAWEKLEAEKEEAAAELQETMIRASIENRNIEKDLEIHHGESLIKLLTHHVKNESKHVNKGEST